jgi:hypothetical protein
MSRRLVAVLALAILPLNSFVAVGNDPQTRRRAPAEPFRSFGILDGKLTQLSEQKAELKRTLGTGHANHFGSGSVPGILTHMDSTISEIEHIANRLEHLYRGRRQPFGVRVFRILHSRAQVVQRDLRSVRRAHVLRDVNRAESALDKDMIALIVQFQSVSGGSAATHCPPRTNMCCQPKRSEDLLPGEQVACKWLCVPRVNACAGILGPRVPRNSREPQR